MRALILCALLSAGCAKTYEDLIAAGDEVICPAEALCPGVQVCVVYEGEPRCKSNLACSVLKQDCATLYSSRSDYGNRKRCALMQTGDGQAAGECTQQYGEAVEGALCSVQILASADFGFFTQGTLGAHFPNEDRECAAGLICHNLPMLDTAGFGTCKRFCRADGDCGSSRRCIDAFGPAVTSASIAFPDGTLGVCVATCALLASGGCTNEPGTVCQPVMEVGSKTAAFGICKKPSDPSASAEGRLCAEGLPCPAGLGCLPDATAFSCRKLCKSGVAACSSGQTCNTTDFALSDGAGYCK